MNIVSLNMCANTTVIALKIKQNILSEYGYRVVIVHEDNTGICHAQGVICKENGPLIDLQYKQHFVHWQCFDS